MRTAINRSLYQLEVNKSQFLALFFHIESIEFFKDELLKIKKAFPDASHHCYAYIFHNARKSCDDGEPHGSAGVPILKLLEKDNLDECALVVVRYFGGTKLGAGRLLRSYVSVASSVLRGAKFGDIVEMNAYQITIPNYDLFYKVLKASENGNFFLENIVYGADVRLLLVSEKEINSLLMESLLKDIRIDKVDKISKVKEIKDEK